MEQAKPDVIDINFGCPVKKVAGKGAGAGMLEISHDAGYYKRSGKGGKRARNRENPIGMGLREPHHHRPCRAAAGLRNQALTIHGRTHSQMYTGEADWSLIGEVKNNPASIFLSSANDITTPEEAKLALKDTA